MDLNETMIEDTNLSDNDDIFDADALQEDTNLDDEAAEQSNYQADGSEEETLEETTEDEADTSKANDDVKIPVKFLGEDKEFSIDEAAPLVQKGLNYDHLKSEYDALKARLQAQEDADKEEFKKTTVNDMVGQGYPKEVAEELVTLRQEKEKREADEVLKQSETQQETKRKDIIANFIAKYPDVNPKDWTDEMREAYSKGEDIIPIYQAIENKKLKDELAALKQNNKNKDKAIGSAKGTGTSKTETDPFLSGLF